MDGDFDTGNVRYKARERYSFGVQANRLEDDRNSVLRAIAAIVYSLDVQKCVDESVYGWGIEQWIVAADAQEGVGIESFGGTNETLQDIVPWTPETGDSVFSGKMLNIIVVGFLCRRDDEVTDVGAAA